MTPQDPLIHGLQPPSFNLDIKSTHAISASCALQSTSGSLSFNLNAAFAAAGGSSQSTPWGISITFNVAAHPVSKQEHEKSPPVYPQEPRDNTINEPPDNQTIEPPLRPAPRAVSDSTLLIPAQSPSPSSESPFNKHVPNASNETQTGSVGEPAEASTIKTPPTTFSESGPFYINPYAEGISKKQRIYERFEHICSHCRYQAFSPEELRLQDYKELKHPINIGEARTTDPLPNPDTIRDLRLPDQIDKGNAAKDSQIMDLMPEHVEPGNTVNDSQAIEQTRESDINPIVLTQSASNAAASHNGSVQPWSKHLEARWSADVVAPTGNFSMSFAMPGHPAQPDLDAGEAARDSDRPKTLTDIEAPKGTPISPPAKTKKSRKKKKRENNVGSGTTESQGVAKVGSRGEVDEGSEEWVPE